jgi:2-polyprenyl-3-methyl-5-hydroxy-6-metoxy-1,4-benzoquinol methylase
VTQGVTAGERAARAAAYENPRPELQRHVPAEARRILDLGCASGALGEALKARGAVEVVGVEVDPAYAEAARPRLDRVVEAEIEELAASDELEVELGEFDCLVCGDVLEHLVDPWTSLRRFAALLKPGGTAVVSLPNVRFWETFWQLGVRGVWPRRLEGIFDRDHLRWFTIATGIELVQQAGLEPFELERLYRLRPAPSPWDRRISVLERTPLRPFFTYQFVITARRR